MFAELSRTWIIVLANGPGAFALLNFVALLVILRILNKLMDRMTALMGKQEAVEGFSEVAKEWRTPPERDGLAHRPCKPEESVGDRQEAP